MVHQRKHGGKTVVFGEGRVVDQTDGESRSLGSTIVEVNDGVDGDRLTILPLEELEEAKPKEVDEAGAVRSRRLSAAAETDEIDVGIDEAVLVLLEEGEISTGSRKTRRGWASTRSLVCEDE